MMPTYLHKGLSKAGASELLKETGVRGAYLVRDSETFAGAYVLCVWSGDRLNQYRILINDDGLLSLTVHEGIRERHFATLDMLMKYYIDKGETNGLACGLKEPVHSKRKTSEDASSSIDPFADYITPFFQYRQTMVDLSVIDGEFIEQLRSYVDDHASQDASTAKQPQYARAHHPPSSLNDAVPGLYHLLEKSSRSLERELQAFLLKLDVVSHLFEPRDHQMDHVVTPNANLKSGGNLTSLLKEMQSCKNKVDDVLQKAHSTLQDMSQHEHELASTVTQIERKRKESSASLQQGLAVHVPPTMFEVKTYKGNIPQLKNVHLSVDLQSGMLTETCPGQETAQQSIYHHKIDQMIKNQMNPAMLELRVEGSKKKKVLVFSDVRSREKFCQLVQAMKNIHMDENLMDTLSIFVGTWNMADEVPADSLSSWLRCQGDGKQLDESLSLIPHDIYVIGTQESALSEKEWASRLKKTLFNIFGIHFQTVTMEKLWGIRLVVLCNPCHVNKISHVETSTVKTGIANALGNKGAVGVSFDFNSTSLCFVCCHLAARAENTAKRNQNYKDICRGLCLGDRRLSQFDLTSRFHHIIWLGDLNYRVDEDIDVVLQQVRGPKSSLLLNCDQLRKVQDQKEAFIEYCEEDITFKPTYRYEKGCRLGKDTYAWKKIKKTVVRVNVPSWCDRVLWKSFPGAYVESMAYGCQNEIRSSDHRPVFSSLRLGVIQQFAAKMTPTDSTIKQDDVIIVFQTLEADVRNTVRQSFYPEFYSTCLDGHVTGMSSSAKQTPGSDTTSVQWIKQSLPKLLRQRHRLVGKIRRAALQVHQLDAVLDSLVVRLDRSKDVRSVRRSLALRTITMEGVRHAYYEYCMRQRREYAYVQRSLQPIVADRDFLEDQYLLIVIRSTDHHEICGQCVLSLKSHISITPEYFETRLLHMTENAGVIRGQMHVTSISTAVNLSRRRRTARTYECVKMGTGDLMLLEGDEEESGTEQVRSKSLAFDLPSPTRKAQPVEEDYASVPPGPERSKNVYSDLAMYSSGPKPPSTDPAPPLPPRTDSLAHPCPMVVPTTGLPALIAGWLGSIGLAQYCRTFLQHECTSLESLDMLTDDRLIDMGVLDYDHRRQIIDSLTKVNAVNSQITGQLQGQGQGRGQGHGQGRQAEACDRPRPVPAPRHYTAPSSRRKNREKVGDLFEL